MTLTYNGATISSPTLPVYSPTKAFARGYIGSLVDDSGDVGVATLAIFPNGLAVAVSLSSFGVTAGVGSIVIL